MSWLNTVDTIFGTQRAKAENSEDHSLSLENGRYGPNLQNHRLVRRTIVGCIWWLAIACLTCKTAGAAEPPASAEPLTPVWSRAAAVRWALQNNPEIAAIRQQHGIAAAGVIIAQTYPFNPVWEAKIRAANGPESAGIGNRVSNEHKVLLDVEIRGQGTYRREVAWAALSRTDWEIAFQELALAIRVLRAFDTVLYRRQKLELLEETIRLNELVVKQVGELRQANKLSAADLIVARTEVDDTRAQISTGRTALVTAQNELRRLLGVVSDSYDLQGSLETPAQETDAQALVQMALEVRADLHARQVAVSEAEARLRLAMADRYGNPNVGPAYEYDPTRINLIGAQVTLPLPVLNTRRGEIEQRRAERARAALELRQTEMVIHQDVRSAVDRLRLARAGAETYQSKILPSLRSALKEMEGLFSQAGVDLLRVIDIRRKLIKARDGYLDALFERRQAQADLAAAAGDPALAMAP
jgi:cobalt-zinc-cadmium efflux system outer membrane protein